MRIRTTPSAAGLRQYIAVRQPGRLRRIQAQSVAARGAQAQPTVADRPGDQNAVGRRNDGVHEHRDGGGKYRRLDGLYCLNTLNPEGGASGGGGVITGGMELVGAAKVTGAPFVNVPPRVSGCG